jgi:hypothetical protein
MPNIDDVQLDMCCCGILLVSGRDQQPGFWEMEIF